EGVWDVIHTADRLKHRRLLIEAFLEYSAAPKIRVEQGMQFEGRTELLRNVGGPGQLRDACSLGSLIAEVLLQVAERAEKSKQALVIVLRQPFIQRSLLDALCQQFRHMAARVVDDLPLLDGFSAKGLLAHHE